MSLFSFFRGKKSNSILVHKRGGDGVKVKTKECSRCHKVLILDMFYKDSYNVSGYGAYCKSCRRIYVNNWNQKKRMENLVERTVEAIAENSRDIGEPSKKYFVCNTCGQRRRKASFYKNKNTDSGLQHRCIYCIKLHDSLKESSDDEILKILDEVQAIIFYSEGSAREKLRDIGIKLLK